MWHFQEQFEEALSIWRTLWSSQKDGELRKVMRHGSYKSKRKEIMWRGLGLVKRDVIGS